jgi:hypothetical protein
MAKCWSHLCEPEIFLVCNGEKVLPTGKCMQQYQIDSLILALFENRTSCIATTTYEKCNIYRKVIMKASCWIFIGVLCLAASVSARYDTQEIALRPGWNAVFFHVQPEPADCEKVFAGTGVASVWQWNQGYSSVQFIQNPNTLLPEQPEWYSWFPSNHPQAFLSDLFRITGGKAYLVHLDEGAAATTVTVTGRPVLPRITWKPNSFTLSGFWVDPEQPPTFEKHFEPSAAHRGQAVFFLDGDGKWKEVSSPETEKIRDGKAYWVKSKGHSDYTGPLAVTTDSGEMVDFGDTRSRIQLTIKNLTGSKATVRIGQRETAAAPDGPEFTELAGTVPLSYYKFTSPMNSGWKNLKSDIQRVVNKGREWQVKLTVRRQDLDANQAAPAGVQARYGRLLEIRDGQGTLIVVPVVSDRTPRNAAMVAGAVPGDMRPGLWVGAANVNKVNQPAYPSYRTTPAPTKSAFQFRLIVHVDTNGQARLLQQAMIMWKAPATTNETGRYVILTDDALAKQYAATAYRDGEFDGRRISTAAFSFADPQSMDYTDSSKKLSCTIIMDYTDPLNPFMHRYHPDHDNLDERFEKVIAEGKESFTIERSLELAFENPAPAGLNSAAWQDTMWGGTYRETVNGIHKDTLYAEGTFILTHVTPISILNDGN